MSPFRAFRLAVRFALREMRGGLSGFFVFLACIALGVAAIGGVNSVARSIAAGVADQGQVLLGGDMRFELNQREATPQERAFLSGLGQVSESAGMRSMARLPDGSDQALVELKAVDGAYPLFGALETEPALPSEALFAERDGAFGAATQDLLLERLGLKLGDRLKLGDAEYELRARIVSEPDSLSDGFGFAPRLMISLDGLKASSLVQPGSLVEHVYKLRLPATMSDAGIEATKQSAAEQFPEAGWSMRTRAAAAPALSANIERFSQFLTLVGLTALMVGGVGVANAVRAYLDGKRAVIATFKSLGASGGFVFAVYLTQILLIAGMAIVAGLALSALMPFAADRALRSLVPLPAEGGVYPGALALAALFGLLVTLAFAILPLGRARDVAAAALFREAGFESRGLPGFRYLAAAAAIALALAALAVLTADDRRLATIFVAAAFSSFVVLRVVAFVVQWLARRAPRIRSTVLRLAVGNIHRPGALTASVVLSLGLGLTLLVTLAQIDGNLRREISGSLSERAPNFFFVDIQGAEVDAFSALIAREAPQGVLAKVPMLRGRIMALNGVPAEKAKVAADGAWVLRGDRGLTYDAQKPANATLTQGTWWPTDYAGEPLVSFSAEEGEALGLKLGDTVTVNVLGRNVTARVANFRQVQWETMGINFVMVFSPNTFAGAPHAWLATLADKASTTADDARLLNAVTRAFPTVTAVRVKDALDVVNRLIGQLGTAIRAAAAVALVSSVLVLAGALAAGNRARIRDAVVLKTLGATRRTLMAAFALEYALLGLATAVFALAAGSAAAWFVTARIMKLPAHVQPEVALATVAAALLVTVGVGLAGTWRVLGHKAAPVLREL
ncbi:ABC transporter permease [Ollibium composti]|uniref:ABC transporter permease n=1 Tax=Ollibium composti TaxID=2675109 RepID=A0ABY2Q6U6_9HYPH|nr:ABC transporter permease [Mesorhizobium composti]THF57123.1 ABC transporter permease [Mesorhizobium composti]